MTTATNPAMITATTPVRYPPMRAVRISLDVFAARSGVHPDLLHRFVALGLIDADTDASGALWFRPAELNTIARIQRLRAGLALNYAAIGLVMDLLDQIDQLHTALHTAAGRSAPPGSTSYRSAPSARS
jgi:chaperone modulatory protein CbpM